MPDNRRLTCTPTTRLWSMGAATALIVFLGGLSTPVSGHEAHAADQSDTGSSHREIDESPSVAQEKAILKRVEAENRGVNPALIEGDEPVAFTNWVRQFTDDKDRSADPAQVGRWEPLQNWPVVGVFASLLADGRVLVFDSVGDGPTESIAGQSFTRAMIWDPVTRHIKRIDVDTGYNIFCSGFASLADGRVFVAGGNADEQLNGLNETHTFNPRSEQWSLGQRMSFDRWYPAVTPLANGEMLITGGGPATPEVRQLDGSIRTLDTAASSYWANRDYPWLQLAPNGRTTFLGPTNQLGLVDTRDDGAWQATTSRDYVYRGYGSHAVFDIGEALVTGGGFEAADHSQTSAVLVDLSSATSDWTGFMNYRRRQHNLTVLADGTVVATGGFASNEDFVDLENSVFAAELWTPQTGKWAVLAEEDRARHYHSTAMLLPDGRILSAGGGLCVVCQEIGYLQKNAQVFTPPYLFRKDGTGQLAARPTIEGAPDRVGYAESFAVGTTEASDIRKVAMIRTGSVTHSTNMEQRYIPLNYSAADDTLQISSPADANIAPPGHYLLFVIDSKGVPSMGKIIAVNDGMIATAPD